jgi:hypothetical protein
MGARPARSRVSEARRNGVVDCGFVPLRAAHSQTKRVAIVQSSYIPWKGYFDLIRAVDHFILLDEVQFTKRDWRSRNRIKTKDGPAWLTIPVQTKGRFTQSIRETRVSDRGWGERHWQTIHASYARAPYYGDYAPAFEALYREPVSDLLSDINHAFIAAICRALDISTTITWSSHYHAAEGRTERLVELCTAVGATTYLSGPRARDYLDEAAFTAAGITVEWADYDGYPEYPQVHPPFDHFVSALDLIFCAGPDATSYMKQL